MFHIILPFAFVSVSRGENVGAIAVKVIIGKFAFLQLHSEFPDLKIVLLVISYINASIIEVVGSHPVLLSFSELTFISTPIFPSEHTIAYGSVSIHFYSTVHHMMWLTS